MSGTYYVPSQFQNDEKLYLLEGIKSHKIFQRLDFWEACLLYSIGLSKNDYNFHEERKSVDTVIIQDGFKDKILGDFMAIAMHMKEFGVKKNDVMELIFKYLERYHLGNESGKVRTLLLTSYGSTLRLS